MRGLLACFALALALSTSAPAAAQLEPCLEDPVACVGDTADEATDAVEDVAGTVEDTIGDTTDDVEETVEGITGGGGGEPAPGPEGSEQTPGNGPGSTDRPRGATGGAGGSAAAPPTTARPGTDARRVERPAAIRAEPPATEPEETAARTLSGSAPTLAFPLGLMLVAGAFLLLQTRFDRSDPKLALAPVESGDEVLTFA